MYGTLTRLRAEHLTQVATGATNDALLTQALTTATSIVDSALGFAFAAYPATATARAFWHEASRRFLQLPYYESGSLTVLGTVGEGVVTAIDSDEYAVEADDHTLLFNDDGWAGGRYSATAKWGYGPAPEEIVKVTMQLAVDLWNARTQRGSSETVGVSGEGQTTTQRGLTGLQYRIVQNTRMAYHAVGVA